MLGLVGVLLFKYSLCEKLHESVSKVDKLLYELTGVYNKLE